MQKRQSTNAFPVSSAEEASPTRSSKVAAGAAGISGGSLLVVLAQNLPESNPCKKWLILCAPAATTGMSALWLWICQLMQTQKHRKVIQEAQETLHKRMEDLNTSPEHREMLRKELEQIQIIEVRYFREQLRRS